MSWVESLPIALICAALLFVPGGILASALGLRGLSAWAAAPVFTVALSAVAAILSGAFGVPWTILPVVAAAVGASALVVIAGRAFRKRAPVPRYPFKFSPTVSATGQFLGWATGAALISWQLVRAFGSPANISQTFDNIFHLNAVRYVLDTANASSMTISSMTNGDDAPYFYPAAWHGLAALLIQVSNAPLSVGVNVLNIVVAATIWPLGCMLLVRTVAGPKPWLVGFSGILAAGFSAFPILLLDFGVLYPNFLSIAMLPVGLASVAAFFRVDTALDWPPIARFTTAPIAACGIALAHPNGVMTLIALSVPVLFVSFWRRYVAPRRWRLHPAESIVATIGLVFLLGIYAVLWKYVRPPADAAFWDRYHSPAGAAFEVVTNSAMNRPVAWVVSLLMLAGIYSAIRNRQHFWLLGCFAITFVLFVVIAGFETSYWRSVITGVWYNDSYRVAAILPLTALPLAAVGFGWIFTHLHVLLKRIFPTSTTNVRSRSEHSSWAFRAGGLVLVTVLVIPMQSSPMNFAVASASRNYVESPSAVLVSTDELALINKLDDIVGPNDVIAVSPWNGGAMAFALANRKTTSRHALSTYPADIAIINEALRNATTDPAVCPAVRAAGVRYVLDFGSQEVHGGDHDFPGFDNLQDSPAVELVEHVGSAKLYRVIAC